MYYRTAPTPRLRSRNLDTPAPVSLRALLDFLRKASGRSIVFVADRSCRPRGQGVGQQFLTKYHFAACVDCGLNGQLRTPSLCPNRGRARTLEAHGYYWRSHIRGPHQRHDTDLRGGGNRLYQLYQCAIPLRWTENRRSSNLRLSAGEPEKPFQFSRGNLLLLLRLVSVSAQSATGNRIKRCPKKTILDSFSKE